MNLRRAKPYGERSLDGSLTTPVSSFTTVEYDGTSVSDNEGLDTKGARFSLGLSWYPVR